MFTATRMAAVTAVLALTGSLALMAGPLDQTETALAPGAALPEMLEPAHFTGRTTASGGTGDMEELPDRTTERWEATFYNTMSDPRMSGNGTSTNYLESIDVGAGKLLSHASTGELVNDDGSYSLACTGAGATGMMDTEWDPLALITCWYEGRDGYDGLVAYTILKTGAPLTGIWDVEGWIWEGDPPVVE